MYTISSKGMKSIARVLEKVCQGASTGDPTGRDEQLIHEIRGTSSREWKDFQMDSDGCDALVKMYDGLMSVCQVDFGSTSEVSLLVRRQNKQSDFNCKVNHTFKQNEFDIVMCVTAELTGRETQRISEFIKIVHMYWANKGEALDKKISEESLKFGAKRDTVENDIYFGLSYPKQR